MSAALDTVHSGPLRSAGRLRALALVAPLYFGQDVLLTFMVMGLGTVLRSHGVGLDTLAVLSLVPIVLAARFLWAPLVDRLGSYVRWLGVAQAGVTGCGVVMAFLDPIHDLGWVLAVTVAAMALSSVQETAASALTIRLVDAEYRSVANGMTTGLIYLGMLVGGSGFLVVYQHWGWSAAVALIVVPNALSMLVLKPLGKLERAGGRDKTVAEKVGLATVITLFRDRAIARWLLIAIPLYVLGYYVASALVTPMLVDARYTLDQVGAITGVGTVIGVVTALGSGFLTARLGRGRALLIFGLLRVVAIAALLPLATGRQGWLIVFAVLLMTIAETAGTSVQGTVIMDASRPSSPGVDSATQGAAVYFVRIAAAPLALSLAAGSGYFTVLVAAAVVATAGTIAAARFRPSSRAGGTDLG